MLDARFRPLDSWPGDKTPAHKRKESTFRASYAKTLDLLETELRHLRAKDIVIQAGFRLEHIRNDGWPRGSAPRPQEPGVILSFHGKDGELSFPCDRYRDWEDNLRAIALGLEALRAVDRYGVTRRSEQYRGWARIEAPSPKVGRESALDLLTSIVQWPRNIVEQNVEAAIREAQIRTHPDRGGSHEMFVRVQEAKGALEAH